jgi:leucyl/phenylalanyl-tRNA--protein transferase
MDTPLTPESVLQAYAVGAFPMGDDAGEIHWFSPDPRCVFEFETFRVPRSMRPVLSKGAFEIRINTRFKEVMTACARRPEGTWISDPIVRLYCELHRMGFAHSLETWRDGKLAGGLYGVSLGGAFFGESMFHRVTDASKVALVSLMRRLRARGFQLVDSQWSTPHLARFGATEIPRAVYLRRLHKAIRLDCRFDG